MAIATGTKAETVINHLHRIGSIKETKLLKSLLTWLIACN
jgi:hypothetical protein